MRTRNKILKTYLLTLAMLSTTLAGYAKDTDYTGRNLTGEDFSGQDCTNDIFKNTTLTDANFYGAKLDGAVFEGATITGADFSWTDFTDNQLKSTASYKSYDLSGVVLDGNHLVGWKFAELNLTNASFEFSNLTTSDFRCATLTNANLINTEIVSADFTETNLTSADLRGANWDSIKGRPIIKNTIWTDGFIINFSMTKQEDSFFIRKYGVYDTGLLMASNEISAKIDTSASITNSTLTLEAGAKLEVVKNATLTLGENGAIEFEITNADSDTNMNIAGNSEFTFEKGGKFLVNLVGDFTEDQFFSILTWNDGATINGLDTLVQGKNIFLTLNGEDLGANWNMKISDNALSVAVPEPSTYAAILGALVLGFVAYRKRK